MKCQGAALTQAAPWWHGMKIGLRLEHYGSPNIDALTISGKRKPSYFSRCIDSMYFTSAYTSA